MLCLGRRQGGKVILMLPTDTQQLLALAGKRVVVTVVDVDRGKVRLAFEADRQIAICREELLEQTQQENQS